MSVRPRRSPRPPERSTIHFVTAWVTRDGNGYQGTIGVGDAAGVKAKQFNNLLQNNLQLRVEGDSIIIGVKRTDVTDKLKMNVLAAVGSNEQWNDDVPNAGSVAIDLSAERPKQGLREIDVSHNNLELPADYKTLADNKPPLITKKGQGRQALILVPGMYSVVNGGCPLRLRLVVKAGYAYLYHKRSGPGVGTISADGAAYSPPICI